MLDGRPALTGAERKRRHDRRMRQGLIHVRADLPPDLGELLIEHGYMADDGSADPDEWGSALIAMARSVMASKMR